MPIFDEPKIDCHLHVIDPARFPYRADTPYRPSAQEVATAAQMQAVFGTYGVRNALLVQPNSGYGDDNRCMLDAIAAGEGRIKGVAVVPHDVSVERLEALQAQGVVGVAFNLTFHGTAYYLGTAALLANLEALGMFLQVQVEKDQLLALLPLIEASKVRVVIDHCGRPSAQAGLDQAGFQALLALGRGGRAVVKLSGMMKVSREAYPYADAWPFVRTLVQAFTLERCVWGSDWPFLRATARVDYGPLISLVQAMFPDAAERRALWWETPRRVFGFE